MTLSRAWLASLLLVACTPPSKSLGSRDPTGDEGSTVSESGTGAVPPAEPGRSVACDPACREIRAHAIDLGRACVNTSAATVLAGCDCDPMYGGAPGCVRWEDDGSLWFSENTDDLLWDFSGGEPAVPVDRGWALCTPEENALAGHACDLDVCANPAQSTCNAEDTCALLASWGSPCGDPASPFDEAGCYRPGCKDDDDCDAGMGCFTNDCISAPSCAYEVERGCSCDDDLLCSSASYCVDERVAGAWTEFEIYETAGPCNPEEVCRWSWTLDPSGALAISEEGVARQAQLSPDDLAFVDTLLDAPGFRSSMLRGYRCGPSVDLFTDYRLTLPAGTLSQRTSGCDLEEYAVEAQLESILRGY